MQSKYKSAYAKKAYAKKRQATKPKAITRAKSAKKTQQAKRRMAAATGSRAISAPVQSGVMVQGGLQTSFTQKQMSGGGLRITGRSYITSVDSNNKWTNGLLAIADCNPVLLNDRVAAIATTYEKYVYQSITYRYVPQCPTSTAGSIMLTFERDPSNPAANGGDSSTFMQNCMSYEHTSITPPWVGSSVTYKRDANEKKLFYISGQGSNFNPRDTSQGHFLCYGANVPTGTGLGFIVMDYVLDLCEPSILPARTGAGLSGVTAATNMPSQWQYTPTAMVTKSGGVGVANNFNTFVDPGTGAYLTSNADCILEIILEGTTVPTNGSVSWCFSELAAKAAVPAPNTLGRGSHLYLVLRRMLNGVAFDPSTIASTTSIVCVTRNLADAIAALGAVTSAVTTTGNFAYANALYPLQTLAAAAPLNIAGFYRQLTLKASDDFQV